MEGCLHFVLLRYRGACGFMRALLHGGGSAFWGNEAVDVSGVRRGDRRE